MGSTTASFDASVKTVSMLAYEGGLIGHLFGNYMVFRRKDKRALEVVDVTSSNTLLQLNFHQQIKYIEVKMTKDNMTAVV